MESKSDEMVLDENRSNKVRETDKSSGNEIDDENFPTEVLSAEGGSLQINTADRKGREIFLQDAVSRDTETSGDVNMEASISPEDVVRAGGFGARDDISSFLPVASDATDFEATIRDARDYEDPQGEVNRPGLGWTGASKTGFRIGSGSKAKFLHTDFPNRTEMGLPFLFAAVMRYILLECELGCFDKC